ncbi:PAS domain S-box protein [Nodosilinea sp. E11]|uniref:PAS domain S-box protein n=1 Tax=Nodosilinea sp. E11 TaxID=3037479 RepID=UPI002934EE90|nr:PAS domain S-box protein [Nodosilinea sp. E11]WOD40322.1 PAS domain S-box protein [Nodosilinea sp. E11]
MRQRRESTRSVGSTLLLSLVLQAAAVAGLIGVLLVNSLATAESSLTLAIALCAGLEAVALSLTIGQRTAAKPMAAATGPGQAIAATLQSAEARYLSILEEQTELIARFKPDGSIIFVNDAYCRYFGLPRANLEGRSYEPRVYPADQPVINRCLAALSPDHPISTVENRVYAKGEVRWTKWTNKALYDEQGHLIELQSVGQDIHDRKQAELALAASETRFQRLVAASPAVIYTVIEGATGIVRFEYLSPAAEEIHEISVADLLQNGSLISEQMHPDDRERYRKAYSASLAAMETFTCEWRIITPSGKTKWLKASSRPEQRPNGEVAWHGIILDISERKRAELERSTLQAALLEAQQVAHIGNWEFDLTSQTITWSPELFHMFGLDPAQGEPTYADYLQLIHPDDVELLQQLVNQAAIAGTPYRLDYRALLPDGSMRYHEGRGRVERDRNGQVVRLFGTALDITDRKLSEIALQASQLRLQLALDSSGTGTWDWNMQTNQVVFDEKQWKAFLGFDPDEPLSNSITEWDNRIHPEDKAQLQADVSQHIAGHTEIYESTHRIRCQDGSYKWNSVQGKIIEWDEQGNPVRFIGIYRDISDSKRAAEALQTSEARFRGIFEQAAVGINQADASGQFIQANQYFCDLLGYTQAELLSLNFRDVTHPDDLNPASISRLFTGELEFVTIEKRYRHKQGDWIWTQATLSAIRDGAGQVVSDLAIVVDIRDLRWANAALQASEARLRAIFDQALAGINQVDTLGQFTEANQYFCDLLGYSRAELLALTIEDLIHPEDFAQYREPVAQILRGEIDNLRLERRQRHKNGDWIWTETMISLLRDEDGQIVGNLAVVIDIRDRKQAEQTIRLQAERETLLREITQHIRQSLDLQTIFNTACQEIRACLQADRVGIFKFYSHADYNAGELVAEAVVNDFAPAIASPIRDHCFGARQAAFYTKGHYSIANDIYQDDLEPCYVELLAQLQVRANLVIPLLCGDRLWGLLCIHQCSGPRQWLETDIELGQQLANQLAIAIQQSILVEQLQSELTERQQAQQALTERNQELAIANQELSRATRLKDEFLANMSHELRTPLNVILGFAQILNADLSLQAQQRDYIRIMHRSGDHLLHLINDILDLSKISANRITLEPESTDLFSLLHDIQAMFQEQAEDKDLRFNLALAPDLPQYIIVDPQKLRQVLINLLGNAVKFTEEGSIVLRVARLPADGGRFEPDSDAVIHLSFSVEDTGIGIAPTELTAIFDAFTQAKAGKISLEGTGLGLTISRSLVHLMGGELTVRSTQGQGSTFCFSLPFALGRAEDVALDNDLGPVIGLAPGQPTYRILVVDDQPENRYLLVAALSQIGLVVEEASSGAEAIARWRQWQPHLIWMDLRMPDQDGCDTTRRIRSEAKASGLPDPIIIALTAQASNDERSQAFAAGCDDFLSKPVQLDQLLGKITDHLGLQYRHAESPEPQISSRLDASALQVMPPDWIAALYQTALLCDSYDTARLIQQIPAEHTELINRLSRCLEEYKFEVILRLTQPHLEATA